MFKGGKILGLQLGRRNLPATIATLLRGSTSCQIYGDQIFDTPIAIPSGKTVYATGAWSWKGAAEAVVLKNAGTIVNLAIAAAGCSVTNTGTATNSTLNSIPI